MKRDVRQFLKQLMVELLAVCLECLLATSKPAHLSHLLPVREDSISYDRTNTYTLAIVGIIRFLQPHPLKGAFLYLRRLLAGDGWRGRAKRWYTDEDGK
jgi:hypothetical protein